MPRWPKRSIEQRFLEKIQVDMNGCWIYTAKARTPNGYGIFDSRPAHIFAFEYRFGPVPKGLVLDHLCRVRLCCNPSHLEAVTLHENILRGNSLAAKNARMTVCSRGHDLVGSNVYMTPNGRRQCRVCKADRDRKRSLIRAGKKG